MVAMLLSAVPTLAVNASRACDSALSAFARAVFSASKPERALSAFAVTAEINCAC